MQIVETVPPERLFRHYLYFSSFSDTMVEHSRELVGQMVERLGLDDRHLAMEIASNDGYLLQFYRHKGVRTLGIEPARNVAAVAREQRGIETVCEFFGRELAAQLVAQNRRADVLHSHNVLAHVADLHGVMGGASFVLKPTGVWVIETPYVRRLIENVEFDTIYHEHLCYFALTPLERMLRLHGLAAFDVQEVAIHGGSLRVFVAPEQSPWVRLRNDSVPRMLEEERRWGVDRPETYRGFSDHVLQLRRSLLDLLHDLRRQGKRIAVYGASAKGATLLNYLGLGPRDLEYVVDRSTVKQTHFTPGSHLRVCDPHRLLETMPDYVLLLTWNFADEILAQQAEYRRRGGRFILPVPEVRIV